MLLVLGMLVIICGFILSNVTENIVIGPILIGIGCFIIIVTLMLALMMKLTT